jgi:hypothetical protein
MQSKADLPAGVDLTMYQSFSCAMVIFWEKAIPTDSEALNARCGLLIGELAVSTSTGSALFLFPIIEMN